MTKKKFKRIYSGSKSGCNSNCTSRHVFRISTSVEINSFANSYRACSGNNKSSWSRSNNRNYSIISTFIY